MAELVPPLTLPLPPPTILPAIEPTLLRFLLCRPTVLETSVFRSRSSAPGVDAVNGEPVSRAAEDKGVLDGPSLGVFRAAESRGVLDAVVVVAVGVSSESLGFEVCVLSWGSTGRPAEEEAVDLRPLVSVAVLTGASTLDAAPGN